jgi:large subunit ribosomal protein L18
MLQLIDDINGVTLASASSYEKDASTKGNKIDQAKSIGKKIAEKASKAGIKDIVFDRNGYLYHGRVKAFADSARENWFKIYTEEYDGIRKSQ